jgi:hypothetical protein
LKAEDLIVDIEQRVDDLLKHTGVWDETKETLRDLLAEHKAGTLDRDDAKYIEGLHKKMFPGRNAAAPGAPAATPPAQAPRDVREVKADNDDVALPSARPGLAADELVAALRQDIADLVTPSDISDRPEAEQTLRREILAALHGKLDDFDAKDEG